MKTQKYVYTLEQVSKIITAIESGNIMEAKDELCSPTDSMIDE